MADTSLTSQSSAESKGTSIIATICIIIGISTLFVLGRLFVRTKILRKAHLDDHLTVLSLLLSYVTVGLEIWAVQSGNGRHVGTLSTEQQSAAVLSTISGFPPNVLAYTVPKFAVVALLVRILHPGRVHRIVLWSLATICLVLVMLCIIILFAQCTPSRAQWDFTITDKSCWSPWVLIDVAILTGAYSAALGLYLAVYPATVLMRLQMNIKKKVILSVALGIGSMWFLLYIDLQEHAAAISRQQRLHLADLVVWTVVEGNTLIIASCIPVLGPLVELALGRRVLSSTDRKYQKQSNTGGLRSGGIGMDGSRPMNRNGNVVGKNSTVIQSRHDRDDASSQEGITVGTAKSAHRPGGILRTDDVTVSFDSRSVADGRKKEGDGPKWDAFQSRD
uniref:Integral membrane protein n=1 Tax=Colletotrichum fructicola (strain Nara gc5) TaxID=1213859 RepID=L2FVC7_COLFN